MNVVTWMNLIGLHISSELVTVLEDSVNTVKLRRSAGTPEASLT
jgi:hypothetical protein